MAPAQPGCKPINRCYTAVQHQSTGLFPYVEVAVETSRPPGGFVKARFTAALIAVGSIWSAAALAAAGVTDNCDRLPHHHVISLDAELEALAVDPVDHVNLEPVAPNIDSLAVLDAVEEEFLSNENVRPFLFLAPRVATVLREIFSAVEEDWAQAPRQLPSSPIAETDDFLDTTSPRLEAMPDFSIEDEALPQFQRQMYRTDI